MVNETICVSIASYRDKDLVNTVKSCWESANNKNNLFFSIVSQAEETEHSDLSFIPEHQIRYVKYHWSESTGACWAREIANRDIEQIYFLQIDSHSRFKLNWDKLILNNYKQSQKFWGDRIILTQYPDPFQIDWDNNKEVFTDIATIRKLVPFWDKNCKMLQAIHNWPEVVDVTNGDEIYFLSANSLFCLTSIMNEIPYDPNLYFTGEEPSLAVRAYTRGIRLVSPVVKFMYSNYNRSNSKRPLHWDDHSQWWETDLKSYARLKQFFNGEDLGIYGVGSKFLYDQYQKIIGIDLTNPLGE
jgi:hypothetical protein